MRTGMFSVLSDLLMFLTCSYRYMQCIVRFTDVSYMFVPVYAVYFQIY